MSRRFLKAAGVTGLLLAAVPVWAQSTVLPVAGGSLTFEHPANWKGTVSSQGDASRLKWAPADPGGVEVHITAITPKTGLPDDADLLKEIREEGEHLLPGAVQKTLDLRPVKGTEARGYVFHLTDKNPEKGPGDFKELHQGAVVVAPVVLAAVLTHSGDTATVDAALAALAGVRFHSTGK